MTAFVLPGNGAGNTPDSLESFHFVIQSTLHIFKPESFQKHKSENEHISRRHLHIDGASPHRSRIQSCRDPAYGPVSWDHRAMDGGADSALHKAVCKQDRGQDAAISTKLLSYIHGHKFPADPGHTVDGLCYPA